jgi:hypothetical protein
VQKHFGNTWKKNPNFGVSPTQKAWYGKGMERKKRIKRATKILENFGMAFLLYVQSGRRVFFVEHHKSEGMFMEEEEARTTTKGNKAKTKTRMQFKTQR